ncbi:MAG: hypothetical protein V2I50_11060, partial [Desulfuromusa sp.]|nr:hypothetical protein [Desulfuromusa sp.]
PLVGTHRWLRADKCGVCFHLRSVPRICRGARVMVSPFCRCSHHGLVYWVKLVGSWRGWWHRSFSRVVQAGRACGIGRLGLAQWDLSMLSQGVSDAGISAAVLAALFGRPVLLRHVKTEG